MHVEQKMFEPEACDDGPADWGPEWGMAYWRSIGAAKSVATGGSVISPFCQGISSRY